MTRTRQGRPPAARRPAAEPAGTRRGPYDAAADAGDPPCRVRVLGGRAPHDEGRSPEGAFGRAPAGGTRPGRPRTGSGGGDGRSAAAGPVGPVEAEQVPRLPIDPRIRRRRIEVRRGEARRRRRILLACLGVAAVLSAAAGAGRSPLLDVDHVDVRGAEHVTRRQVVDAARLTGRPAMLDVDTRSVARRVEALPWVRRATARRQWPGTVRIDVVERRPTAVLPAGEGVWAVVDEAGRVLAVGPDKPAGLPVIGNLPPPGRPGTALSPAARPALDVAAALPEEVRARVADVATVEGGEVELQLVAPGGIVRLGPPVDLGEKLQVLATVLSKADLARVASIDVRVPRAPALTRR